MRATDLFDNYIFGTLSAEEKNDFETRLKTDAEFATAFEKHKTLIEGINQHEQSVHLKQILSTIHKQEFGKDAKIVNLKEDTFIKKHGKTFAVAASVAVIAVIGTVTLLSTGGYLLKQQSNAITDLKRDVTELKYSQDAIIEGITGATNKRIKNYAPANIEGTGFALNNRGYFITSFHMVKNADSVFVTNNVLDRASAKLVASEPALDIAIYKIDNIEAIKNLAFPFSFKESGSEIGDKIFTLGYPRRDAVYGEGALSSMTGFNNDTTMYQISIPVNPGNSGGPLMDEQGNIIGVIRGKQSSAEATGFAIKSNFIKQTIDRLENDSLKKELSLVTKKSNLKGLKRSEQIKKIQPFVFNVMVYKK
ncbi:MAG: trypsin-like peptidase protein [Bacteroidetes bacterium]|jgi:S1-C subfamily serine protease|nr:trypsin-like peptidase protein [Bacteroidota bacterium]